MKILGIIFKVIFALVGFVVIAAAGFIGFLWIGYSLKQQYVSQDTTQNIWDSIEQEYPAIYKVAMTLPGVVVVGESGYDYGATYET